MGYKFLLEALKTWKMPHPQSERLEKNAMESMQTTASRRREATDVTPIPRSRRDKRAPIRPAKRRPLVGVRLSARLGHATHTGETIMKMAKASDADMEMALKLCSALEAVERRFFPKGSEGEHDPEDFDIDDDAQCGRVLRHLDGILRGGSIGRVIWGMAVLLDPENKLVDPEARTLEPHPEAVAAEQDSKALTWIEHQHLEELGMGLVIDAPNDGQYYVCGDSGTAHYGKTLREALHKARTE